MGGDSSEWGDLVDFSSGSKATNQKRKRKGRGLIEPESGKWKVECVSTTAMSPANDDIPASQGRPSKHRKMPEGGPRGQRDGIG